MRILVDRFIYQGLRYTPSRHQRKRDSVKRCREVFELICAAALGWCSCHCGCWPALAGVDARALGLAEGMPKFRAGNRIVARRGVGARHLGLLALRSASGLGLAGDGAGRPAPTAFNRAGEKLQATGGELPRVSDGVGPLRRDGLALPLIGEKVSGTCGGCGWKRWSSGLRRTAGQVLVAGGGSGIPASVVDHHGVDPAQQRGGARDPGLGPPRPGFRGRRAGLP
jgi:hypothetical protein